MRGRRKTLAAKAEKKQLRMDAGLISELFFTVAEITINMTYNKTGVLEPLARSVNFSPSSYAVFKLNCLCPECAEGTFDFAKIISSMVKIGKTASKGKIACDGCSAPECSDVAYTIAIKYSKIN